ncbi:hypothetical protein AVEN_183502-1 [Araneus ventricosus]|uniref:Uncharacterized protein n=1 Tax=Araneus ventricosus TaxID=182803 RepID=A0A4Y2NF00_ARAVE|nr:hypothetical protein AVEN_183502-1 [Araneus ventricosus]
MGKLTFIFFKSLLQKTSRNLNFKMATWQLKHDIKILIRMYYGNQSMKTRKAAFMGIGTHRRMLKFLKRLIIGGCSSKVSDKDIT